MAKKKKPKCVNTKIDGTVCLLFTVANHECCFHFLSQTNPNSSFSYLIEMAKDDFFFQDAIHQSLAPGSWGGKKKHFTHKWIIPATVFDEFYRAFDYWLSMHRTLGYGNFLAQKEGEKEGKKLAIRHTFLANQRRTLVTHALKSPWTKPKFTPRFPPASG